MYLENQGKCPRWLWFQTREREADNVLTQLFTKNIQVWFKKERLEKQTDRKRGRKQPTKKERRREKKDIHIYIFVQGRCLGPNQTTNKRTERKRDRQTGRH